MPEQDNKQQRINALLVGLRGAITALSTKAPTSVRMILDGYLPRLSPSLADAGDSAFPVTVRRAKFNPDRTIAGSKYGILFFYVGEAVLVYYAASHDKASDSFVTILDDRVEFLKAIARDGIDTFVVDGDDRSGYRLVSKTIKAAEEKLADELRNSPKQETLSGVGDSRGGRSGTGVTPLPKRKPNVVHPD